MLRDLAAVVSISFISLICLACCCGGSGSRDRQFNSPERADVSIEPDQPAGTQQNKPARSEPDDSAVGYAGRAFAKRLLPKYLKAPSTAEWGDRASVKELAELTDQQGTTCRRWLVVGDVDAQNSFGAMLRMEWGIVVIRILGSHDYVAPVGILDGKTVFMEDAYRAALDWRNARQVAKKLDDEQRAKQAKEEDDRQRKQAADAERLEKQAARERELIEKPRRDEKTAQTLLAFARDELKAGRDPLSGEIKPANLKAARKNLDSILASYPNTQAAVEAKKLLESLK